MMTTAKQNRLQLHFPKGTSSENAKKMLKAIDALAEATGQPPAEILDLRMHFDKPGPDGVMISDEGYALHFVKNIPTNDEDGWYVYKDGECIHEGPIDNPHIAERRAAEHFLGWEADKKDIS